MPQLFSLLKLHQSLYLPRSIRPLADWFGVYKKAIKKFPILAKEYNLWLERDF
ncbi:hypothetical protein KKB43_04665 [Patescibacteria group bacterium]|nr:hypothetical protein [Patescibacteria group bacterium]